MFLKVAVLLAVVGYAYSQTCLSIVGGCVLGQFCPKGTCVSGICCITDPAENCNNTMDDPFCIASASKCSDPQVGPAMKKQCASTCKSCTTSGATPTGTGSCVDIAANCVQNANLCNNSIYYDLMTKQCPKTCNRCPGSVTTSPSTCVDKVNPKTGVSDCPQDAYLCNNTLYYDVMTRECPKTCGRCPGSNNGVTTSPGSSNCVDKINPKTGVSDCPQDAYLCNNPTYYDLMTQQCPKTCGRC